MLKSIFLFLIPINLFSQIPGSVDTLKKSIPVALNDRIIKCSYKDRDGNLWFGTTWAGAIRYDGNNFKSFNEKDSLLGEVNAILQDRKNTFWFGTTTGIYKYDGKKFALQKIPGSAGFMSYFANPARVSDTNSFRVYSMLEDKTGNIWLGTNEGAYKYNGASYKNFLGEGGTEFPDGKHHNVISGMIQDKTGKTWFASLSCGGVSSYDGTKMLNFTKRDGLSDCMITSIAADSTGAVWIAGQDSGLFKYSTKRIKRVEAPAGMLNHITCIYIDKKGVIWIGTSGGESNEGKLVKYMGSTFEDVSGGMNGPVSIWSITEDYEGNIWIGGRNGMLIRYNGEEFTNFKIELMKVTGE